MIGKVKIQDSQRNNLVELADMVCGAVARSCARKRRSAQTYGHLVAHREIYVQFWPKQKLRLYPFRNAHHTVTVQAGVVIRDETTLNRPAGQAINGQTQRDISPRLL